MLGNCSTTEPGTTLPPPEVLSVLNFEVLLILPGFYVTYLAKHMKGAYICIFE